MSIVTDAVGEGLSARQSEKEAANKGQEEAPAAAEAAATEAPATEAPAADSATEAFQIKQIAIKGAHRSFS